MSEIAQSQLPTGGSYPHAASLIGLKVSATVLVGILCAAPPFATSSSPATSDARLARAAMQTTAGLPVEATRRSAAGALGELRRVAGLTWEQLARLFGVSRRAVHFWASGEVMSAANEEKLQRVVGVVRAADRGSAQLNREALLSVGNQGLSAFDLLIEGKYQEALAAVGRGTAPVRMSPKVSQVRRTYESMSPAALLDAAADVVHVESGPSRIAKAIRK